MAIAEKTGSALEQELSNAIRSAAPEVVRNVINKAQEGSYLHAKFLFELAGLDLRQGAGADEDGAESLAAYLLRELREPDHNDAEAPAEG
ncbi:MAG TPA: hypothetical protein VMZ25_11400 [Terriglobales bacterium]|nr:hypothetical protein [Terriglobales bacterium]